jgi:hypothetical protein
MGSAKFWLRVLNVYPNEWKVVRRLYIFQFLQGAGIAFFFTSAFAQFLERFPITELPWVMVYSALLLWVAGFTYTKLEHKLSFETFNWSVIGFMAISILLLWLFNYRFDQPWFLYLIMAWFNVLYLLNNMQFWGIAAVLFDLRQSKRLFAVISAGDIPAKFVGYTLASIFIPYTGTTNLLLMGACCMAASLPFFNKIVQTGPPEIHGYPDHNPTLHPLHHAAKISKIVKNIASNTYIRRIAFISLITSTCIVLINYGFYGEVRKAYHDDVALGTFIAAFYASLRVIAFITKMVFTSRLTASLGIRQALFITPVGMVLLIGVIVFASHLTHDEKIIFYLFGVSSMLVDVLRTSFNSPVLLTMMQPLPTHERLRAHNIVKGIMDPFASLLSGIFLLSLFYLHSHVNLMFLCYVLLVLGALWIIGVLLVNRQYLGILIKTIGTRYFSREDFDLNDEAVIEKLTRKMMNSSDVEVISILRMLNSKIDPAAEELITKLLTHPSEQVRLETLRLIGNRKISGTRPHLERLLNEEAPAELKLQAIKTYCRIAAKEWNLAPWYESEDKSRQQAAITGMLVNENEDIRSIAEKKITELIQSRDREERRAAAIILAEIRDHYDHAAHANLINDNDPGLRTLAMKAVGRASKHETIAALFTQLNVREKQVLEALLNAGPAVIPQVKDKILDPATPEALAERLINLCGKIGGDAAVKALLDVLRKQPAQAAAIVKALHRTRYAADEETQKILEAIARKYIVFGVELLHMQQALYKKDARYAVLNSSLQVEIQEIRETLLSLFGVMYDREKINQVKYGLNAKHKESVANAMEIIELTVKKDIGRQFNTMFEIAGIEERCNALRSLFTEKQYREIEPILGRILSEKPVQYYDWTKACSLYISKKYVHPLDAGLYRKYMESDNKLLKETATFASASS